MPTDIVAIRRGQSPASTTTSGPGLPGRAIRDLGAALKVSLADRRHQREATAVAVFYFPTFATHAETTTSNQTRSVAIIDFRLAPDQLSVNPDAVPWQSGIRECGGHNRDRHAPVASGAGHCYCAAASSPPGCHVCGAYAAGSETQRIFGVSDTH